MLSNSSNVLITGGVFTENRTSGLSAIDKLYAKSAPGAFHDSANRTDAPRCHPKTRQAVRKKILEWLKDPSSPLLMWLYGPAGAGKSAIAQMIVEICLEEGWLSASFFFSRRAKAESDETKLIATLAYQLLKYIPATRPFIEAAVTNDPLIFDLTIRKQIQALILGPLSQVSSSLSEPTSPKLIIIDGLDECSNQEAQGQIVQQFADAVQHMQRKIPHKVIIASRPEQWLASAFGDEQVVPHLERLCLDDTWCPDKDIEVFLANSFADIQRKHPLAAHIAPGWPSKFVISELVFKSSGQFIFASVVVKYVNSPRHNPVDRLGVVRGLKKDERNPPFAVLDALYRQILMSVEEQSLLLPVLRIAFMPLIPPLVDLTMALKTIQCLLRLSNGVVELLLNDILSILAVHTSGKLSEITFHHVSFQDFLFDRDRSKEFFIGNGTVRDDLAQDCLRFISNYPDMDFDDCWEICLHGPVHLLYGIPLERMAAGVRTALDNLDMHAILRSASITKTRRDFVNVPAAIVQLMQFLMPKDASSPLPPAVSKLKHWILTHLRGFLFNGFDNVVWIDLTVFALPYNEVGTHGVRKYISRITQILARALSLSVIPKPVFTKELVLCWDLIARFSAIFTSSDLCGDYAITEARQTNAACLCTQYVIDPIPPRQSKIEEDLGIFTDALYLSAYFIQLSRFDKTLISRCRTILGLNYLEDEAVLREAKQLRSRAMIVLGKRIVELFYQGVPQEIREGGQESWESCLIELLLDAAVDYLHRNHQMSERLFRLLDSSRHY